MHQNGFVHRDIKPENFVIGLGARQHYIYLIDYGLAKSYLDGSSGAHVPLQTGKKHLTGTCRYASVWTHNGLEQSRRDDLE